MNLDAALSAVMTPIGDTALYHEAVAVIGEHLARRLERPVGAVVVTIDTGGRKLLDGVERVWGSVPVFPAAQNYDRDRDHPIWFEWVTGQPPPDLPWVICDVHITTGATVGALLDELTEHGPIPAVTVLAARARATGRQHILDAHSGVSIIDPATYLHQHPPDRTNGKKPAP